MTGLLVRADAGAELGSGHFMRTLALARAWVNRGGEAAFLSRCDSEGLLERATTAGIGVQRLERSYPDRADLDTTLGALRRLEQSHRRRPWLVADGYFFSPAYHAAVRAAGYPLLVVDDIGHLDFYDANVVLNQNAGSESISYRCETDTALLRGPRFALLQPEFRRMSASLLAGAGVDEGGGLHLLVTLGGGDPHDVTTRVIEALRRTAEGIGEVTIVAGASNPRVPVLWRRVEQARAAGLPASLKVDVREMAAQMAAADLAVSAAGSTCWELAAAGVPMVVVVTADNQRGIAAALAEGGAAVNLGWHTEVDTNAIAAAVSRLVRAPEARRNLRERARRLVDGRGAERVARFLRLRNLRERL